MVYVHFLLIFTFFLYSLSAFFFGLKNIKFPFSLTPFFNPIGAFVVTDTVMFGLFFTLTSFFWMIFNQWILFLLTFSLFWTIRSIGEQIYWFSEQFAVKHRNPPHTLWLNRFFKGEEVWIVMQTFWQCCSVVSIILSIYLAAIFIDSF